MLEIIALIFSLPPHQTIELSETDAAVFLTVYPGGGFDTVTTADFTQLGQQILDCGFS
jgi:hypothetical protein